MSNDALNPDLRVVRKLITRETAGQPILDYLERRFTYRPRAAWLAAMQQGLLLIDGTQADPEALLQLGQTISLDMTDVAEPSIDPSHHVLHEDADLLIVEKSGDLPVHPAGAFFKNTLQHILARRYGALHIITRLDRETSGLILAARHPAAAAALGRQMERRLIGKAYSVIVEGSPPWRSLDACGAIRPTVGGVVRKRFSFTPAADYLALGAQGCRTELELAESFHGMSLLHCRLHTGRTHQIRATCQGLNLPVVGDKIYGLDEARFVRFIDGTLTEQDRLDLRLPRQALHCCRLDFHHPADGRPMSFSSALPQDMAALLHCPRPPWPEREAPAPC